MRRYYGVRWIYGRGAVYTAAGITRPARDVFVFQSRRERDEWVADRPTDRPASGGYREAARRADLMRVELRELGIVGEVVS